MENLVIDPITKEYLRYKTNDSLKLKLGLLYNQQYVILTNSGLHSNYITIDILFNQHHNINLIYGNELYHETTELIKYYKNIKSYNIQNLDLELISNQNNILFIESCSNPNGHIFDFSMIQKLRELSLKLYVICDNTWLSGIVFNPFDYDVDIVTTSLSKFYSGGHAIGGACIFKNIEDYEIMNKYIRVVGIHISPLQLKIIDEQINYVKERVTHASELTVNVLEYLSQYKNIIINHPLLKSHPSCELIKKYFKDDLVSSIFTIGFKINKEILYDILNKLTIFSIETSFGSPQTKIDTFINSYDDISFIRLSVGYSDNINRIKKGIDELFQYVL